MYLSRIARLFWEEKVYYKNFGANEFSLVETLQMHQIKVI